LGENKMISALTKNKKVVTLGFVFLFSFLGIQSSNADPGRRLEINVNALTYANTNPTDLPTNPWWGSVRDTDAVYRTFGVQANDTLIFNLSNVSNENDRNYFEIVGYFQNNAGFSINLSKNGQVVTPITITWAGESGYLLNGSANLDSYRMEVTIGSNPVMQGFNSIGPVLGTVGFPSDGNGLYYLWELHSSGQWTGTSASTVALRKSTNLTFKESLYASDKLSDPDGQLRKTVDAIDAKYGNLIK